MIVGRMGSSVTSETVGAQGISSFSKPRTIFIVSRLTVMTRTKSSREFAGTGCSGNSQEIRRDGLQQDEGKGPSFKRSREFQSLLQFPERIVNLSLRNFEFHLSPRPLFPSR